MDCSAKPTRARFRRGGFTFTEVLFAVLILGIGFIMIAGIFPVSLQQTRLNQEETAGAQIALGATEYVQSVPNTSTSIPADGKAHPALDAAVGSLSAGQLSDLIKGNLILPTDPRKAWVPFVLRGLDTFGQPQSYAQLILVPVQIRNRTTYNSSDLAKMMTPPSTTVAIASGQATFSGSNMNLVGEGTFIVIADSSGTPQYNGYVFRVGTVVNAASNIWYVGLGFDEPVSVSGTAYIVGKGLTGVNPDGNVQDISAYVSFINLR